MTTGSPFLALLRGINVGGRNIIPMNDLRACLEACGFTCVRTYIQSGNILFRSGETKATALTKTLEAELSRQFDYDARVVVLSQRKYRTAVRSAPEGWGTDDEYKHNAMFTVTGTTPQRLLDSLPAPKQQFETVTAGPGVIYWSVSKEHATKATCMKLSQERAYQLMTVRNHNTVFKLLELFKEI